jgi:hypothetical protein
MALSFSGSGQYLWAADAAGLSVDSGTWCAMAWAWLDPSGTAGLRSIIGKYDGSVPKYEYALYFGNDVGRMKVLYYDTGGSLIANPVDSASMSTGVWVPVWTYYKDVGDVNAADELGLQVSSRSLVNAYANPTYLTRHDSSARFIVGGLFGAGGASNYWMGSLGPIAIWNNHILTQDEWTYLRRGGNPLRCSVKPKHYCPMNGVLSTYEGNWGTPTSPLTVVNASKASTHPPLAPLSARLWGSTIWVPGITTITGSFSISSVGSETYVGRNNVRASLPITSTGSSSYTAVNQVRSALQLSSSGSTSFSGRVSVRVGLGIAAAGDNLYGAYVKVNGALAVPVTGSLSLSGMNRVLAGFTNIANADLTLQGLNHILAGLNISGSGAVVQDGHLVIEDGMLTEASGEISMSALVRVLSGMQSSSNASVAFSQRIRLSFEASGAMQLAGVVQVLGELGIPVEGQAEFSGTVQILGTFTCMGVAMVTFRSRNRLYVTTLTAIDDLNALDKLGVENLLEAIDVN